MTGSKRIEFETWFARLSGWAEHILARLEEGVVAKLELGGYRYIRYTTRAMKYRYAAVQQLTRKIINIVNCELANKLDLLLICFHDAPV